MKFHLWRLWIVMTVLCAIFALCANTPNDQFAFKQEVVITKGFYRGQSAVIFDNYWFNNYQVKLGSNWGKVVIIDGSCLEAIK